MSRELLQLFDPRPGGGDFLLDPLHLFWIVELALGPRELQLELLKLLVIEVELLLLLLVERHVATLSENGRIREAIRPADIRSTLAVSSFASLRDNRIVESSKMSIGPLNDHGLKTVSDSLAQLECLLLVLSRRRKSARQQFTKVSVRPIIVREQPVYQFTFHYPDRVTHENLDLRVAADRAVQLLTSTFENAALYTPAADYSLRASDDQSFRCQARPPTKAAEAPAAHNRAKEYLIPEGSPCPFLTEIGVMTSEGRVKSAMRHKFRQINRFLELIDDVVDSLPDGRELRIVDFGCGKSYLTFALHHLLTAIRGRTVRIIGLDRKAEVIRNCASIAARLGCQGLEFREGDIATHEEMEPLDLAVSLHACDTATDDALAQALRWQTRVILAVPCCQHELAKTLNSCELSPLARHGILYERLAALATDALRAMVLEIGGYATQVVEFIDLEHTAKNLLIRAVRREKAGSAQRTARLAEYESWKGLLGIENSYLERALGPTFFQA
jgi:SAM-dependent methyltransferase